MAERPPSKAEGTTTAGYIVTTWPRLSQTFVLNEILTLEERGFVFVSAGGGGDGQLLMQTYVCALHILGSRADFATLMAVGVNAPPDFARKLAAEARGLPIRILPFVDDSIDVLDPADLSPESLAERLVEDLERSDYPKPNGTPPMDGAVQAADRLWELLQAGNYAASA